MENKRYALVGLVGKEERCIKTFFLDYKKEDKDNIYFKNQFANKCKKENLGLITTEGAAFLDYYVFTEIENINKYQYELMDMLQEEHKYQIKELESKIAKLEDNKKAIENSQKEIELGRMGKTVKILGKTTNINIRPTKTFTCEHCGKILEVGKVVTRLKYNRNNTLNGVRYVIDSKVYLCGMRCEIAYKNENKSILSVRSEQIMLDVDDKVF